MRFEHDPKTNVATFRANQQGVTIVLPIPAAASVLRDLRRSAASYQVPSEATQVLRHQLEAALAAEEATQRLDPAFAGPPDPAQVRMDMRMEQESFPIRMLPTDRTLEEIQRDTGVTRG